MKKILSFFSSSFKIVIGVIVGVFLIFLFQNRAILGVTHSFNQDLSLIESRNELCAIVEDDEVVLTEKLTESKNSLCSDVEIKFFTFTKRFSLYILLLLTTFIGGFFALLFKYPKIRRLNKALKLANSELKTTRSELDQLRNQSLTDDISKVEAINPPEEDKKDDTET